MHTEDVMSESSRRPEASTEGGALYLGAALAQQSHVDRAKARLKDARRAAAAAVFFGAGDAEAARVQRDLQLAEANLVCEERAAQAGEES